MVPPFVTLVADSAVPIVLWSVPLSAAAELLTTVETLPAKDPFVLNADSTADPWKPVGQASVVAHVGWLDTVPLLGVRVRLPGSNGLAAMAKPAVSSPVPATRPTVARASASRRALAELRLLAFSSRNGPCA